MEISIILLYLILPFIIASYAKSKGKSYLNYFLISLLFSPLIGFIIVLVSKESSDVKLKRISEEEEMRFKVRKRLEEGKSVNEILNISNKKIKIIEIAITDLDLENADKLKILITNANNYWNGNEHRDQLINFLNDVCKDQTDCLNLIKAYHSKFNQDVINVIRKMYSSYDIMRSLLCVFIKYKVIEDERPYDKYIKLID